jgi:predicted CxxxxCH...CXXCH cytochrome family protein
LALETVALFGDTANNEGTMAISKIKRLLISVMLFAPAMAFASPDRYMGTGTCSSSNCHGSTHARKSSNVLQNEYFTWLKHDKHSQAYTVLLKADAKRMASLMGLGDPAKEPLCLKCHSTYVPSAAQRGEKY